MRMPYMRWARQTTREVLESFTGNRELIGVLTGQWGDYGLPPGKSSFAIHATIAEHYFGGASYPVGGASAIAAAIVPRIENAGGVVVTSAEVSAILLDGTKTTGVRISDGRELLSGLVLSDAGAANTFERLLPQQLPALDSLRRRLRSLQPSTAHVSLYIGLSQSDAALGLQGTNLWVYPSFDHDANVEQFARNIDSPLPVVYLSFPSAKDPDFQRRHPGKSTLEAITMLPYTVFERWGEMRWKRRGDEYDALKERLAARLCAEVELQVPSVVGNIAHTELSTPVTTRHFMNYGHGEIYGIASKPERFLMRELGARTPIRGLYLAGQDAASLGVVGALYGGVIGASAATGKNFFSVVSKPYVAHTENW
jgi:all-trans-retinol 13,14-reductase